MGIVRWHRRVLGHSGGIFADELRGDDVSGVSLNSPNAITDNYRKTLKTPPSDIARAPATGECLGGWSSAVPLRIGC